MTTTIGYVALIATALLGLMCTLVAPAILSDRNEFLKGFVNHELLAILGVILAITLASSGQLHLSFNQIEERYRKPGALMNSRNGVKRAAHWLIGLFLLAIVDVLIKPLLASSEWSQSLFNAAAVFILFWNVLILLSITQAVFGIGPDIHDDEPR